MKVARVETRKCRQKFHEIHEEENRGVGAEFLSGEGQQD